MTPPTRIPLDIAGSVPWLTEAEVQALWKKVGEPLLNCPVGNLRTKAIEIACSGTLSPGEVAFFIMIAMDTILEKQA